MSDKRWIEARGLRVVAVVGIFVWLDCRGAHGQKPVPAAQTRSLDSAATPDVAQKGVELDRLVAVVNGDVILESDVDEELRMGVFQPFRDTVGNQSREEAINRLIDRALILQQALLQAQAPISDARVQEQLNVLRKDIPACKEYHCETEAGWEKFVAAQGFTMDELISRWRQRMEVLEFIETRFRTGIRISNDQIKEYYEKTLLPQYERQKATPPAMDTIADRIQEILLQQQVGNLLEDWLKSLRAQGTVRIIQEGGGML